MYRKLFYLVSLTLVLSLGLTSIARSADLICWWKLDETSGKIAADSSGKHNDGTLEGNPQWVPGKVDGALNLDGDDYVVIDAVADDITNNDITISLWVKTTDNDAEVIACNSATGGNVVRLAIDSGKLAIDESAPSGHSITRVDDDEWHFYTYARSGAMGYIYVDGVEENTFAAGFNFSATNLWSIGQEWDDTTPSGFLPGTVDDLRIYNDALSWVEIQGIMSGQGYPYASNPVPEDGAIYEDVWVNMAWTPGAFAVSHNVYFGTNFDNVNNGAADTFLGNQGAAYVIVGFPGYPYPEGLIPGTTYYWRIDEVNDLNPDSPWKGPVWSFMVPPKTAYNPDPPDGGKNVDPDMKLTWTPGYGAKVHYVYFGTDFDTVSNATGGLPQALASYDPPGTLAQDTVYYWRVDEFDALGTYKGDVWSFRTIPVITITDPDLIGYWKFDEGRGDKTLDWSGYGNDGRLGGNTKWVDGILGGAVDLAGGYVAIDGVVDDITNNNITLSAWIKTTQSSEGNVFASNSSGSGHVLLFGIDNGNIYVDDGPATDYPPAVNDDQWHMITFVMNGTRIYLYTDGVLAGTVTTSIDITSEVRWSIGQEWDNSTPSDFYIGMVDDARFYNASLTDEKVKLLMRGDPLVAWNPKPFNGTVVDVEQAKQPLRWSPGDNATQHDVYFGADLRAVDNAKTTDTSGVYRGRQAGTSYTVPDSLDWGTGPYYWRIDEYNADGTISTGSTWSFTVADYLIVDDFESYTDNDTAGEAIWQSWVDGYGVPSNGAETSYPLPPYAEQTIVHSGLQSMPFMYNNTAGVRNSESLKTLTASRDWTKYGVGELSLWYIGSASNAREPIYVSIANRTGAPAVIYNNDPTAAQSDVWTEWVIDLQDFANKGINLADVDKIAIGLGSTGTMTSPGGSGKMYFDDIDLYQPSAP